MRAVMTQDHEHFRTQTRRFVEEFIVPFHAQWERAGVVPRELWRDAGQRGLLCTTVPEEFGGSSADFGYSAVIIEELARVNASGVGFSLHSDIVAPYLLAYAQDGPKRRWLRKSNLSLAHSSPISLGWRKD